MSWACASMKMGAKAMVSAAPKRSIRGLHAVDAHIHKAARCHIAVKDVGVTMREDIVVARGVLAKADGGAPDAPDLLEGVLKLIIGRIMQGAHRLERNNVRTLGGVEDLLGLAAV